MEYSSAVQSSALTSPSKPSLFELLSEGQLNSLLAPTCRYLLALLTHRHPRYLLRILNSFDEVYALLSLIVEKYYLESFGGGVHGEFLRPEKGEGPEGEGRGDQEDCPSCAERGARAGHYSEFKGRCLEKSGSDGWCAILEEEAGRGI